MVGLWEGPALQVKSAACLKWQAGWGGTPEGAEALEPREGGPGPRQPPCPALVAALVGTVILLGTWGAGASCPPTREVPSWDSGAVSLSPAPSCWGPQLVPLGWRCGGLGRTGSIFPWRPCGHRHPDFGLHAVGEHFLLV